MTDTPTLEQRRDELKMYEELRDKAFANVAKAATRDWPEGDVCDRGEYVLIQAQVARSFEQDVAQLRANLAGEPTRPYPDHCYYDDGGGDYPDQYCGSGDEIDLERIEFELRLGGVYDPKRIVDRTEEWLEAEHEKISARYELETARLEAEAD